MKELTYKLTRPDWAEIVLSNKDGITTNMGNNTTIKQTRIAFLKFVRHMETYIGCKKEKITL